MNDDDTQSREESDQQQTGSWNSQSLMFFWGTIPLEVVRFTINKVFCSLAAVSLDQMEREFFILWRPDYQPLCLIRRNDAWQQSHIVSVPPPGHTPRTHPWPSLFLFLCPIDLPIFFQCANQKRAGSKTEFYLSKILFLIREFFHFWMDCPFFWII